MRGSNFGWLLGVLLAVVPRLDAFAVTPDEVAEDGSLEWALLPAFSANSDIGIGFGALLNLARLDKNIRPYRWNLRTQLKMSVKEGPSGAEFPTHDHFIEYDLPGLLDGRLRLFLEATFFKNIVAGYWGIGNASADKESDNPRRYQYVMTYPEAIATARLALVGELEVFATLGYRYLMIDKYEGSKLEEDALGQGLHGTSDFSWLQGGLGLLWDTRDDEIFPLSGMFHEVSIRGSAGADHGYAGVNMMGRLYFSLLERHLILAVRVGLDVLLGDAPFYELARVGGLSTFDFGGAKGTRGIPQGRYHGKTKLLGDVELRGVFLDFKLFGVDFGLGASLFVDSGRTWSGVFDGLDGDFPGWKFGAGGGVRLLWGKSMVIRGDIAYSPDASPIGFYLEAGQAF